MHKDISSQYVKESNAPQRVNVEGIFMQKVDLIITGTLVPMASQEIIKDGAIVVHAGRIIDCSSSKNITGRYKADTLLEAPDSLIMPGLINGHTHVGMSLLRGVGDKAKNLHEWLTDYIFPLEKKVLNEDFVYWSTLLSCYEMLQSGVTTFADMYFFEHVITHAVELAGMRAVLGETIFLEQDIEYAQEFCIKLKNNAMVTPAYAPHSLYSCSAETLQTAHKQSIEHKVPFIIHVAEQNQEVVQLRKKTGLSPAEYMHSLGILTSNVIIAHGVHFTESDLKIIAHAGASIIYNPSSNMKLASGIAPIKSMLEAGIAVGLGTDGTASNNALDSFMEMKTGALLQDLCVTEYCKPLTPFEMVKLATCDGARAIKMGDKIGTLEVGKQADIIIVSAQELHQLPNFDVFSQLVYSSKSTDVQTVVIEGKIVMHNRKMLTLFDQVKQLRERIQFYHDKILNK